MAKQKQLSPIEKKLSLPAATAAPVAAAATPAKPEKIAAPIKEVAPVAVKTEVAPKAAAPKKETNPAVASKSAKAPAPKASKPAKAPKAPKVKPLTYEEIVAKVSEQLMKRDASKIGIDIAAQIVVVGDVEGIFYIEVKDGKIDVQPYDYKNNDFEIRIPADMLLKVAEGKLDIAAAIITGKASFSGDAAKAFALGTLF